MQGASSGRIWRNLTRNCSPLRSQRPGPRSEGSAACSQGVSRCCPDTLAPLRPDSGLRGPSSALSPLLLKVLLGHRPLSKVPQTKLRLEWASAGQSRKAAQRGSDTKLKSHSKVGRGAQLLPRAKGPNSLLTLSPAGSAKAMPWDCGCH